MSRDSARAHIPIWSEPNEPITSGTIVKPGFSASWSRGNSICAECSARWILSLHMTGARSARRSIQSRSTAILPSGVETESASGGTRRFSIQARWLGARITTRRKSAPRMSRTARHAVSPEYAHPAWGSRITFGRATDAAASEETACSHASARARISRSDPGYHVPASVLSSVMDTSCERGTSCRTVFSCGNYSTIFTPLGIEGLIMRRKHYSRHHVVLLYFPCAGQLAQDIGRELAPSPPPTVF